MTNKHLNSEMILKHLESLTQKFACFVCKQQNRKPVIITNCGHHFCHGCIMKVILEGKNNSVCPQCNIKIDLKSLITNKSVNQLFIHFECLLKACSNELKLSVQLPPIMKTPNSKGKKTPVSGTKHQVQLSGKTPTSFKSPADNKESNNIKTKEIQGEIKLPPCAGVEKIAVSVAKLPAQPLEQKRRGRKPRSKSPAVSKEKVDTKTRDLEEEIKSPSGIIRRAPSKRASALKAAKTIPVMLKSEESTPDTPQLDIPVLEKPNNTQTKVSTWLRDAATGCIPTQDRPVITTTPITQSTLVSVSQSCKKLPTPRITQVPDDYDASERIVKDPYEFIPSQPDSIVKRPNIKSKPAAQRKKLGNAKKTNEIVMKKAEEKVCEEPDMLLFKSQSEQYIAEKEEKRLRELERPIYMDTEASNSKQKGRRGKSLPLKQQTAQKQVENSDEDEPVFVPRGKTARKYGGLKRKTLPLHESGDEEESKLHKKLCEAEKHSLIIEKNKVGTSESKLISQVVSRESKPRSLSIAIDSPPASETHQKQIPSTLSPVEIAETHKKSKLGMPSPGFSRLKKMKTDFRSPGKNKIVPLDVSTTSIAQKDLNTESVMDLDASITEILNSKSTRKSVRFNAVPSQQAETSKLQESLNSSVSSIGAPDLERGEELIKAVEKIEHEIENNIITDSDLETTAQDSQQSTTLIENSVPMETETLSFFKYIPNKTLVEEKTEEPSVQDKEKTEENVTDVVVSPLKEVSNKLDSQKDTPVSQSLIIRLEKINDVPKRKTFSLELDTGDIMTDIPSRESTQQQLISLTQSKSQQSVATPPLAVIEEPPVSRVRFMKQGKLYPCEPYQVPFYKLGYLAPSLQNKGLKYQPLRRCSCGGVSSANDKTTNACSTNTSQPSKIAQQSIEAQTTQSLLPGISKLSKSVATNTSQLSKPALSSVEAQTTQSLYPEISKLSKSIATNTSQPSKPALSSVEAQTTQSLYPEISKLSKSIATNTSQPSKPSSVEAQMTPSLILPETRDFQSSLQQKASISESRITDSTTDSNMTNNLNIARFISSQQEVSDTVKKNVKTLKTSTQKIVFSQEPLFSSDSLPSTMSQDTCLAKMAVDLDTPEEVKNPVVNNEPVEIEEEDEITVIEKTQEENPKLFSTFSKIGPVKSKVTEELELSPAFTIDSDDILQATLSQPQKSVLFGVNKNEAIFESPSKLSKTSTPMSRNESDYNDEDVVQVRSALKTRKRGRPIIISSDSESEGELKQIVKRPTRLSMKKNIISDTETIKISSNDSDAPIRALVKADLEYAKKVAAEQASSAEESEATVNLDSTPRNSAPPTPLIQGDAQKSEEKVNLKKPGFTSPENRKAPITTESKVLDSMHDESLLEENTAISELNNPFFDISVLLDRTEAIDTDVVYKGTEPVKQFTSPASVLKTPVKVSTPAVEKLLIPVVEKNKQCEESDSDSDMIFESSPKQSAAFKVASSTLPVCPPVNPKVTKVVTPKNKPTPTSNRQISIIWSSLDADSVKLMERFLQRFKQIVKHSTSFVPNTTHLVCPHEENSKCTFSTLKFLLSVAKGSWVVSINWIKDCLIADRIIPEEPYEIGPRASRISSEKLFKDFEFYCADGTYDHVDKKNLVQIIKYAGGQVINFDQLKTPCTSRYRFVISPNEDICPELQNCRYPIIFLDWIVDSVEQYRLSAVTPHVARSIDDVIVSKMQLPKEMLEIPEDESTSYTSTNFTNNTITQP